MLDLYLGYVIDKPLQSEMRIISKTTKNIIEGFDTMTTKQKKVETIPYLFCYEQKKSPFGERLLPVVF